MLAKGLSYFDNVPLSVFGMLVFLAAFAAVTVWTYSGARPKEFYQRLAGQPLEDGEE